MVALNVLELKLKIVLIKTHVQGQKIVNGAVGHHVVQLVDQEGGADTNLVGLGAMEQIRFIAIMDHVPIKVLNQIFCKPQ